MSFRIYLAADYALHLLDHVTLAFASNAVQNGRVIFVQKAYVKEYCHDAKQEYLDEENFKKAVARLTTRTGWTKRELEGWLALTSFKTCATNKVMGNKSARQESALMGMVGGPRGERARAVRGMRELIVKRVGGAIKPVVSFAMLREWKDNKR